MEFADGKHDFSLLVQVIGQSFDFAKINLCTELLVLVYGFCLICAITSKLNFVLTRGKWINKKTFGKIKKTVCLNLVQVLKKSSRTK